MPDMARPWQKSLTRTVIVTTDGFDGCQNADVAGKVDRLKHSLVTALPVQCDNGRS